MVSRHFGQICLLAFERSYRTFLQGLRTMLALLLVIVIYGFSLLPQDQTIWLGLCVFCLAQSCQLSPFWRFETNMLVSYLISSLLLVASFFFIKSFALICVYSFFLAFLIPVFAYYKLNTVYAIIIWIIPEYALLSQESWKDTFSSLLMNTFAFLICLAVSSVILRPNVAKECLYEAKATLRTLSFYTNLVAQYVIHKNDRNAALVGAQRKELSLRLQSLRNIRAELLAHLEKQRKPKKREKYFLYFLVATLQESFVEATISIGVRIRLVEISPAEEQQIRVIFKTIDKVIFALIDSLKEKKRLSLAAIEGMYKDIERDLLAQDGEMKKTLNEGLLSFYKECRKNIEFIRAEFYSLKNDEEQQCSL